MKLAAVHSDYFKHIYFAERPLCFKAVEQGFAIGPQGEHEGYVDDDREYTYGAGSIIRKSDSTI